jgi:hypothetical protein
MTFLSRVLALFPASVVLLAMLSLGLAMSPIQALWRILAGAALPVILYLYPVLAYRVLIHFKPLKTPLREELTGAHYSHWWGSHQVQLIYLVLPVLERFLRVVPGVYSAWLRLWGARIGQQVYWTPNVEVHDRALLQLGDGVLLGHEVKLVSHVVIPHRQHLRLYANPIVIGSGCFIGAGSVLGPGVHVDAQQVLPVRTEGRINQRFEKKQ